MKITTNRKKKSWLLLPVLLLILGGCDKSHSDIEPEPNPGRDEALEQVEVTVENPGNASGLRYVNLMGEQAYSHGDVFMTREHEIDFMVYNGSSTGINFITPDNGSVLDGFGQGRGVRDFWQVKNAGTLIKLPANPSNETLFDNLTSSVQLRETIAELYSTITQIPGYNSREHGPGHVLEVTSGDILLFSSASKNIQAIIKITDHEPGNAGSVTFIAKIDKMDQKEIEAPIPFEPGAPPVQFDFSYGSTNAGGYIDLKTLQVYTEAEAEEQPELIDIAVLEGSSLHTNFFTINSERFNAFNAALLTRIRLWSTRNAGNIVKLRANTVGDDFFDRLDNNYDDLKRAYDMAINNGATYYGEDEGRLVEVGGNSSSSTAQEFIFFRSIDRDFYMVMKIVNKVRVSTSRGELETLVRIGIPESD